MDDCSIAGRTRKLRREIELLQQAERHYRDNRSHSLAENAEREKREFRVLAIREELRTLIEKAKQQLSTTDLTVSEIAYELGFEHPQSFSKLFKTKTKVSPLEFRQSFN